MKLAPVLIATVLTSLSLFASAQQTAAPPTPPSTAVQPPPPPDGGPRRVTRYQTFSRTMNSDGMLTGERLGPPGIWWKNPDVIQKLSITADQQKRMDDIFQQSRLQLIDLKANVEKQEVTLEPMLSANPPDTNKVLAQIDKIAQARAELEKANARMLLSIRTVLTPDQWTKLQEDERSNRKMIILRKGMPGGPGGFGGGFPGPGGPDGHFRYQPEIDDSPL